MVYHIRIEDGSKKAKSIINMLQELQQDYGFIQVSQEDPDTIAELELRYQDFLKKPKGKTWSTLLKELQK